MATAVHQTTKSLDTAGAILPESKWAFRLKWAIDIFICLLCLPVLLPLMLIIGLCIVVDSHGPILFKQTRVGKNDTRFTILKFRSMVPQSDDSGHRDFMKQYIHGQVERYNGAYKPPIQKQVTPVGQFLRKTSLDELPQIFNVLSGDMSLVGPRPNVEWEVQEYEDWHRERLTVKPGITGLAQVRGRSNIPFNELVTFDIEYVRTQSLKLDLRILLETIITVFKRNGAR